MLTSVSSKVRKGIKLQLQPLTANRSEAVKKSNQGDFKLKCGALVAF
jgi:hypothetical protein